MTTLQSRIHAVCSPTESAEYALLMDKANECGDLADIAEFEAFEKHLCEMYGIDITQQSPGNSPQDCVK